MHIMLMAVDFIIRSKNWDESVQSCSLVLNTIQLCTDHKSTATLAE